MKMKLLELKFEKALYASRWLLAPLYMGLSLALILLAIKFFQEVIHFFPIIFSTSESDMVLVILSLIDIDDGEEKLSWLGKLDSGSLKQKVAASIVAISSIHLLQKFMNADQIDNDKLMWYVIIHITFVVSAIGMAWVDKMNQHK
jgi:uncharacterized membrane protein YqhA